MQSMSTHQVQCFRSHSVSHTPNIINTVQFLHQVSMSIILPNIREQFKDRVVQQVENILGDDADVVLMIFVVYNMDCHIKNCTWQSDAKEKSNFFKQHILRCIYWMYHFMFVFDHLLNMLAQYHVYLIPDVKTNFYGVVMGQKKKNWSSKDAIWNN